MKKLISIMLFLTVFSSGSFALVQYFNVSMNSTIQVMGWTKDWMIAFDSQDCYSEWLEHGMSRPDNKTFFMPTPGSINWTVSMASSWCANSSQFPFPLNYSQMPLYNESNSTPELIAQNCDALGQCELTFKMPPRFDLKPMTPPTYISLPSQIWEGVLLQKKMADDEIIEKSKIISNLNLQVGEQDLIANDLLQAKYEIASLIGQVNESRMQNIELLNKSADDRLTYGEYRYGEGFDNAKSSLYFWKGLTVSLFIVFGLLLVFGKHIYRGFSE